MEHTISQEALFDKWSSHEDEPWLLASHLGITPAQLADLTDSPIFARRVAAWRALARVQREKLVFNHQRAAAATLRETMSSPDPLEARRAATTLAHLCRNMLMPAAGGTGPARIAQRGAAPDAAVQGDTAQGDTAQGDTAQGLTSFQSGASEIPTPPQSAAPSNPPTPSSTPPEPPTPPLPFDAPLPLPLVASSPQVVTRLTARAGAAARASGP